MNLQKLFGLLLGYPECCIEQFLEETGFGRRSVGGFVPCDAHAKVDDLSTVLGRNPEIEPVEFEDFLNTGLTFEGGVEVYGKYGKEEFFRDCWERAS